MGLTSTQSYIAERQSLGDVLGYEGTVVAGSYNSADGTCQVVVGETLSAPGLDDDQQGIALTGSLMTPMVGFQAGPQGGERCMLFPTRGGYKIMLTHGQDNNGTDAPQAPQGELWYLHAKAGTVGAGNMPVFDSGYKVTNDGPMQGDGLGGTHYGNVGALTRGTTGQGFVDELNDTSLTAKKETPGGMTDVMDDPSQTITHTAGPNVFTELNYAQLQALLSAASEVYTLVDGNGNAISHVVAEGGAVALGALAGNGRLVPAIRTTDISQMVGNSSSGINIQRWVDLVFTMAALSSAMISAGVPNMIGISTIVAQMSTQFGVTVPGLSDLPGYSEILTPAGSSVVKML